MQLQSGQTMFVVLAGIFLGLTSLTNAKTCPNAEDILPCICTEDGSSTNELVCNGLTMSKLRDTLSRFDNIPLRRLRIQNSNLPFIPVLDRTNITILVVENSVLDDIFGVYYTGAVADTLEGIVFENVTFKPISISKYLLSLKKLNELTVTRSHLSFKMLNLSEVLLPISKVTFAGNGLKELDNFAFRQLYSLHTLILKNNSLSEFKRRMLPFKYSRIVELDLSFNNFSGFPDDVFDGMPLLNILRLEGNRFQKLNSTYMKKISHQLNEVNLSGNPVVCNCDMSWLGARENPKVFIGECTAPESLKGKKLADLKKDDFANCPISVK